jgi:hypothetical protein
MTDEELEEAIKNPPEILEEEVEIPEPEAPKVEEQEKEEEVEEEEEEVEKPKSRREELRIQQLLAKYKEETRAPEPEKVKDAIDYESELNADPELIKRLDEDRRRVADASYRQGMESNKSILFHTRLEVDAPRVEAKYPQLDKESDDFNPQLANAINTMYLSTVGYDEKNDSVRDPNLRYSTYVESVFELANEIAGEKTEATRTNIKKQAAKTGLRPDGGGSKKLNLNKAPSQMTDEELDAVIALSIPSR